MSIPFLTGFLMPKYKQTLLVYRGTFNNYILYETVLPINDIQVSVYSIKKSKQI